MLNLKFGSNENTIRKIGRRFENQLENEWLDDPLVIKMIKDVDKIIEVKGRAIYSPVLGVISPLELSGGVQALILMKFEPEYEYYGTQCGDNCAKWILEIAERQDITLAFEHLMNFPEPFEIKIMNNGKLVKNMAELVDEAIEFLGGDAE